MKIAISDDVGQLKVVTTTPGIDTTIKPTPATIHPRVKSYLAPDARNAVLSMCVIQSWLGESTDAVAVAQASGNIMVVDTNSGAILFTHNQANVDSRGGKITTLEYLPELSLLTVGTTTGHTTFVSTTTASARTHSFAPPSKPLDGAELCVTRVHPSRKGPQEGLPGAVAIAGREREVEIWVPTNPQEDVIVWKQDFSSKNIKNDHNNLRVPVWTTDLQFLPDREDGNFAVAVVTKSASIRIYHPGLARRPILEISLAVSNPPTALLVTPCSASFNSSVKEGSTPCLIISTTTGLTVLYDVSQKRSIGQYNSSGTGSILSTNIGMLDGTRVLAAVGSDRYLYVWNLESRKLVSRVWLKTRGTGVGILAGSSGLVEEDMVKIVEKEVKPAELDGEQDDELEGEDVWDGMKEVGAEGDGEVDEDNDDILEDVDSEEEKENDSEMEEVQPAPKSSKKRKEAIEPSSKSKKKQRN